MVSLAGDEVEAFNVAFANGEVILLMLLELVPLAAILSSQMTLEKLKKSQ